MEFVIATRNKKKVEEMMRLLDGLPISLSTLDDFPDCPEVIEDADTFKGNAAKKALAVSGYTKKPAISDDSGLEVYALNSAPGVYSARYAGKGADDMKNLEKLLKEIKGVEESKRGARFVCVIALAFPDGSVKVFDGFVEGSIGIEPKGSNGFGYDPVFYPKGYKRTFAEMTGEEKDRLSHRATALKALREYIVRFLSPESSR